MSFKATFLSGLVITFITFVLDASMDKDLMSFKMALMGGLVITFIAFVLDASMD